MPSPDKKTRLGTEAVPGTAKKKTPPARDKRPGSRSQLGRRIGEHDAQRLEQWCQRRWFSSLDMTDRRAALAISLGLHGLRGIEVSHAALWHLRNDGLLYVKTAKRGRPREIQLDARLAEAIRTHAPRGHDAGSPLVRSRTGKPLTDETLSNYMLRVAHVVDGEYAFHCLRHTAAMRLYEATRDVFAVMHLLGHATLSQTHRYINRFTPVDAAALPRWAPWPPTRPKLHVPTEPPQHTPPWWQTLWDSEARRIQRWTRPDLTPPRPDDPPPAA